jgi:hypothetical protein
MHYILRSKNVLDPAAVNFNPESVFAWNVVPDESLAPAASWEVFADQEALEAALTAAPDINQPQE